MPDATLHGFAPSEILKSGLTTPVVKDHEHQKASKYRCLDKLMSCGSVFFIFKENMEENRRNGSFGRNGYVKKAEK